MNICCISTCFYTYEYLSYLYLLLCVFFLISLIFYKKIYNNTFLFKTFLILALYVIISKILLPLDIDELEGHLELANENFNWVSLFQLKEILKTDAIVNPHLMRLMFL